MRPTHILIIKWPYKWDGDEIHYFYNELDFNRALEQWINIQNREGWSNRDSVHLIYGPISARTDMDAHNANT